MDEKLMIERENLFSVIGFMRIDYDLKSNELLVYAIIYHYSQTQDQYFTGTMQYLSDFVGTTTRTIFNVLTTLIEKGLIVKEEYFEQNQRLVRYKVARGGMKNFHRGYEKISYKESKESNEKEKGIKEKDYKESKEISNLTKPNNYTELDIGSNISQNNIPNQNNIYNNKETQLQLDFEKNCSIVETSNLSSAKMVLEHWNKVMGKREMFTEKKEKAINKQLKIKSIDIIMLCIDRYKTMLNDKDYFFKYEWSLEDFLNRKKGIDDFLDNGEKWTNYILQKTNPNKKGKRIIDEPNWMKSRNQESEQFTSEEERKQAEELSKKLLGK